MNVKNCRKCGKLFNYVFGMQVCQDCQNAQEELFQKAKEYVRENPGCSANELAKEVGVEMQQIRQWIREERLQFTEDSQIQLNCETCGARILTGRFCDACKNNMSNSLQSAFGMNSKPVKQEPEKRRTAESNKMRFLK